MSEDAEAVIRAAQHSLIHGGQFLENLPRLVIKIGKGRLWSSVAPRGRAPFVEFSDFATHPLPDGLGSDIGRLIDLCKGNDQAVKFLEAQRGREESVSVRKGPKPKGDSLSDNESSSQGTCSAYLLRRLSRMDGDWLDRYEAGEFPSVRQAAIAAGIVKVPTVIDKLRAAWKKATKEERLAFLEEINP
jgi:hypothetical protein